MAEETGGADQILLSELLLREDQHQMVEPGLVDRLRPFHRSAFAADRGRGFPRRYAWSAERLRRAQRLPNCSARHGIVRRKRHAATSQSYYLNPFFSSFRRDGHGRRGHGVRDLAARQRRKDTVDQRARRIGAQLDRDAVAPALALIGEVDGQHVVERRVIRMVEIDIGGVDLHPALAALGAADKSGFFDDVGAHSGRLPIPRRCCWRTSPDCG